MARHPLRQLRGLPVVHRLRAQHEAQPFPELILAGGGGIGPARADVVEEVPRLEGRPQRVVKVGAAGGVWFQPQRQSGGLHMALHEAEDARREDQHPRAGEFFRPVFPGTNAVLECKDPPVHGRAAQHRAGALEQLGAVAAEELPGLRQKEKHAPCGEGTEAPVQLERVRPAALRRGDHRDVHARQPPVRNRHGARVEDHARIAGGLLAGEVGIQ